MRVYSGLRRQFTEDEVRLLRSIGSQAAAAILNSRLLAEQIQADRLQRQMRRAAQVQRRMIPSVPPCVTGFELGSAYVPTLEIGGDFFDFLVLDDGRLAMAIADVVGKGIPAALTMASIRAALRTQCASALSADSGEARIMAYVNRHLGRDSKPGEFATLFFAVFDPAARVLSYCNGGHEPPLLLRDGAFTPLTTGGPVIGAFADATYDRGRCELRAGDVLVMVTDGVIEEMNFEGDLFGRARLRESILRYRALDAGQLAPQLLWDVRRFAGLADQSDDIAIVVAKVT